jgi:hypothetical protein
MWVVNVNDLGLIIPEWLEWIEWAEWNNVVFINKVIWEVSLLCNITWLMVSLVLGWDNNWNIIWIKCESKDQDWICINVNWPKGENWNWIKCSVII